MKFKRVELNTKTILWITLAFIIIFGYLGMAATMRFPPFSHKPYVIIILPAYIDLGVPATAQIGQPIKFTFMLSNEGTANAIISSIMYLEVEKNGGRILDFNTIQTVPSPEFTVSPQNSEKIDVIFQPENAKTTKEIYLQITYRPGYKIIRTQKITLQWD